MRKSKTIGILLLTFIALFVILINSKDTIKDQIRFIAINNGNFTIIDSRNNCISKNSFDYIAPLSDNMYRVCKDKKWGYLDETGAIVAVPFTYDASTDFSEELASVSLNGKWGYINKNNEIFIDFQYDWAGAFVHNSALVKLDNLYYLINENNVRISNYYHDCTLIYSGAYIAIENEDDTPVLIDTYGKEMYKFDINFIEVIGFQNDILCYKYRHGFDVKCKIISISNGFTILDNLDGLTPPTANRLFYGIKQDNKLMWGLINLNTLNIGSLKYCNVISNSDKLFGVAIEKAGDILWGFIDEDEIMVIEPRYYSVGSFSNGYAPIAIVEDSGEMKWGILDLTGRIIIDPQYDYIISCK